MRRTTAIVALAVAGACNYAGRPLGDDTGDDGPTADGRYDAAAPDARIDATPADPCNDWMFEPEEFAPCAIEKPIPGPISINTGTWTLDDGGVLTDGVGTTLTLPHNSINHITVVSVERLDVLTPAVLRLIGDDPIAIAVWGDATISGTINVSSNFFDPDPAAGANSDDCPGGGSAPGVGGNQSGGDGGSGGGGFLGDGGHGGTGNNASGNGDGGGGGRGRQLPDRIEGGCRGANAQSGTSGYGGPGGGAVLLAVMHTATISGTITAGGGGGGGATGGGDEGGGGGGSGGMIKLETQSLTVTGTATLAANGGQGGGGNHNVNAAPGVDGTDSDQEPWVDNKEGGGGSGGAGGFTGHFDGNDASQVNDGGAGGGGGAGFIVYRGYSLQSISGSATISPPAQPF